ncbi:MAG: chloride channel protein [Bacteroidales bacterium]|nr:chloride channel protein [Bacteroidales bacterium]
MKMILWRERHITEKNFVLILSLFTGLLGGVAALLLKYAIHWIQNMLTNHFDSEQANYLYLLYPIVGILLAGVYVRYIVKDDISHGVTRILYAISQRKSILKPHNMYTSMVASAVTIGFGGSVGAEAPIVFTGAAIGSNVGRFFKMDQRTLMLLLGCGATAGIAGIFKAPIAGLLFTIEVLMLDLTAFSIMPLLISAVTAASIAYIFSGPMAQFSFHQTDPFLAERIPYVILLGIVCGFVSLYFTKCMFWAEDFLRKISNPWKKFIIGAIILSILIFILPPLYGEGYNAILDIYNGTYEQMTVNSFFYEGRESFWIFSLFILLVSLFKVFATAATNGGGGVGGTFAPSLFLGNMAGFLFAYVLNHFGYAPFLPEKNFAVIGMAGVMSGVMHAPLMGIFLSAELTGGFDLFLPLMIVSTLSYGTIRIFEPYSIYTRRLAIKGELITHHKDKAVLTLLKMDSVIEKDLQTVSPEMTLGDIVGVISKSERNIYPVIDENGKFLALVLLNDIRNIMFQPRLYNKMKVKQFMISPPAKLEVGMSMEEVMKIFDNTNAWNLPVVENGKYIGFVSKAKIFSSYRKVLRHFSED